MYSVYLYIRIICILYILIYIYRICSVDHFVIIYCQFRLYKTKRRKKEKERNRKNELIIRLLKIILHYYAIISFQRLRTSCHVLYICICATYVCFLLICRIMSRMNKKKIKEF